MQRRRYLAVAATGLTLPLAGCAGDDDADRDDNDDPADDGDDDAGDDATDDSADDSDDDPGDDATDDSADDSDDDPGDDDGADGSDDDPDGEPRSDDPQLLDIRETLGGDAPLFDSETVSLSGNGDAVTDEFSLGSVLTVVAFEFEDAGFDNYQLSLDGATEELLVNETDPVTGAVAVPAEAGDHLIDVTAPGDWDLHVGQPFAEPAEIRTVPAEASGEGPAVVGPLEVEGQVTVAGAHSGDSNFIVDAYDEDDSGLLAGELVVNEIGEWDGETLMDYPGILWLDVQADGGWTLEIE